MNHYSSNIKRVCIYGTGGVGGYFGGKIAEVFSTPQCSESGVYFIARGEHLRAIKQHGIVVKTPERIISVKPTLAVDDIREIPSPDLILLCVKSYDLQQAATAINLVAHDNTVIIPLLNGVDIYDRIRTNLDNAVVLPASVYLGTYIERPGVINQSGGNGVIIFGPDRQVPEYTGGNVKDFFQKIGIKYEWYDDPWPKIWEKYMFIAAFGMVTALTGETLGAIMKNEKHRNMVRGIMEEIYAISSKKAIKLPAEIIEKSMNKASNFPNEARTSYQRDIENKSQYNEGDLFGGTIIREGKALGVATPITEAVYQRINEMKRA
jgi:2-dehydropantoate 2-reductase